MRSFVAAPMRHGRLFLAGDAAHIVPPTGAKGLNLALGDVVVLANALRAALADKTWDLADAYSDTCLRRVWRATHFSWWMTSMLHVNPEADGFDEQLMLTQLRYVTSSRAAALSLAENYTGYRRSACELSTVDLLTGRGGAAAAPATAARTAPPRSRLSVSASAPGGGVLVKQLQGAQPVPEHVDLAADRAGQAAARAGRPPLDGVQLGQPAGQLLVPDRAVLAAITSSAASRTATVKSGSGRRPARSARPSRCASARRRPPPSAGRSWSAPGWCRSAGPRPSRAGPGRAGCAAGRPRAPDAACGRAAGGRDPARARCPGCQPNIPAASPTSDGAM